jgi:hypothetical protein
MENIRSETTAALAAVAKCAHPGCTCTIVESGERYCSDYCLAQDSGERAAADDDECQCGHAECEHARAPVAAPLMTGSLPTS